MLKPLLAVDAPSLLYRAFYALPDSIKGSDGRPVNALLGATNLILLEAERHDPRAIVLCFGAEAATYRKELLPAYHADRPEMPADLVPQWEAAGAFFGSFGWLVTEHETLEADDLLGSYARLESEAGGRALLLTGDRDMFQCASDRVTVLYVSTGVRGAPEVGPAEVHERYGVEPAQVPDFIALRGDPSDGIPGAKGVGEKTAAELLRTHGSLEGALRHHTCDRLGHRAQVGDQVAGVYRQRVALASGRFAMIDNGLGFELVPWKPALDQHLGRHVNGVVQPGGAIDWSLGRKRGLGLG